MSIESCHRECRVRGEFMYIPLLLHLSQWQELGLKCKIAKGVWVK